MNIFKLPYSNNKSIEIVADHIAIQWTSYKSPDESYTEHVPLLTRLVYLHPREFNGKKEFTYYDIETDTLYIMEDVHGIS